MRAIENVKEILRYVIKYTVKPYNVDSESDEYRLRSIPLNWLFRKASFTCRRLRMLEAIVFKKNSCVNIRLVKIEGNMLYIQDIDIVDGTPLSDIKPYVPHFDVRKVDKIGLLIKRVKRLYETRNDGRFIK